MALERDNAAERLDRIDKLIAENKPPRAEQQIARPDTLEAPLQVVSLPQGPALTFSRRGSS